MTTQDSTPQPRHAGNHEGTFPPPIRNAVDTPPQAPPMQAAVAVPSRTREQLIRTDVTDPIGMATPHRRRRILAIAAAGAVVIGGITFAVVGRGGSDDKQPDKVAMTPAPPAPAPAPTPTPTPTEVKPAPPAPTPVEPAPTPVEVKPADPTPAPPPANKPKHPVTNKAPANTDKPKQVETKQPDPPKAAEPEQPKQLDASAFAAQYQSVGAELKAFENAKGADAASELWSRYRMIRFADAIATQPKRDEASAVLGKLHRDIASRK
jgi:hypothetical protein